MWGAPAEPADSYYEVRPECTDVPKTRFKIKPGKTLSARKWQAAFTPEGQLDIGKTLSRIHRGGIHPSIRGEVWEFLLGCCEPKSTFDEREEIRQRRRLQYSAWKEECHQIFPVVGSGKFITAPVVTEDGQPIQDPLVLQETNSGISASSSKMVKELLSHGPLDKKVIQWMLTLHQIGLDVIRTDRTLVFYEKQENLSKLWDILAVYAWVDRDVGYCQGMSDLCSPMIILLENEADAFWCFERLMRRLRGNFRCTESSVGVEAQLSNLASITQVIDPKLHQHLETLGGGDYLFAFRMLMVLFRREFSFCDSLYLWEMMWALEYDPHLFYLYEEAESAASTKSEGSKAKAKSIRQCGKYERENMKNGAKTSEAPLPISVFLVASVLKDKSSKLLQEARGLDDVVKILNDMTGNLDAKKACIGAMKLHKKYLKKAKQT
ncbi:Rab-GAP TBC domain-containing protein [Citrus sinensis]|uniref:rab GTPase-activating protein 22-like isoform X2 n=1 Tax=Citrus sinensis TaxID=2711 RepID=UPI0003D77948|nr:rab GTPase-activating protein 22-like isoform X2 [Citrus sinensis]KAH9651469.1 Rab-GAP TBC domain-containing protein [Citrus sinensis]